MRANTLSKTPPQGRRHKAFLLAVSTRLLHLAVCLFPVWFLLQRKGCTAVCSYQESQGARWSCVSCCQERPQVTQPARSALLSSLISGKQWISAFRGRNELWARFRSVTLRNVGKSHFPSDRPHSKEPAGRGKPLHVPKAWAIHQGASCCNWVVHAVFLAGMTWKSAIAVRQAQSSFWE